MSIFSYSNLLFGNRTFVFLSLVDLVIICLHMNVSVRFYCWSYHYFSWWYMIDRDTWVRWWFASTSINEIHFYKSIWSLSIFFRLEIDLELVFFSFTLEAIITNFLYCQQSFPFPSFFFVSNLDSYMYLFVQIYTLNSLYSLKAASACT
jgi:hypothetical protein